MQDIWIEKYRPKTLKEVVGHREIVERLSAYVRTKNIPHLLFAGPAGTGKTTCAIAIARELFGEHWKQNFQELNASDERGINVVRGKIKDFARTAPIGDVGFKIIFLDEADALTSEAQAALRRTMEMYSRICRFILSANYSSRIIEPIQSRCAIFRFRPLSDDDIKGYLQMIAGRENLRITKDALDAIAFMARGDMRKAINTLQICASVSREIDADIVYESTATIRPEKIRELVELALKGEFMASRKMLEELFTKYGLSGEDILNHIYYTIYDLPIPEDRKINLIEKIGEADYRIVEGSNERIQLEALLANFALIGRTLR
ncbi:MAG: replication factor C small subunit [Thermoplasmata archaeon]|nr:MAG: replication factor C small subunit [Thermoplasmata archaeon]RLF51938.1 MAG: replication factor C small subunit [Thermoplasmata archaeon]